MLATTSDSLPESATWSPADIHALLDAVTKRPVLYKPSSIPLKRRNEIWFEVAAEVRALGSRGYTGPQCWNQFIVLRDDFARFCKHPKRYATTVPVIEAQAHRCRLLHRSLLAKAVTVLDDSTDTETESELQGAAGSALAEGSATVAMTKTVVDRDEPERFVNMLVPMLERLDAASRTRVTKEIYGVLINAIK